MTKESGQSLVEVLVALVVAAVVIVALIIVIVTSLKNAQFAKNQALATKYAQEAIDQIKTIRDRDGQVTFASSPGCCTTLPAPAPANTCNFSDIWTCHFTAIPGNPSPCSVPNLPSSAPGCYFKVASQEGEILNEPTTTNLDEDLGNGLTRQIFATDSATYQEEKIITVKVKWTDSQGSHESNLQTSITAK